ncbi:MAG: hypothetical protein QOG98_1419 [Pseudonocardiales bacterium]|nr:hypothetical protein [Pseudonocardiales bacterium]
MSESHETAVDSREESDPPATSTEPWPGTDRASIQQVAAKRPPDLPRKDDCVQARRSCTGGTGAHD